MQKNIPGLRFPEFKDVWEKKILGKIFSISAGGDIGTENVSQTQNEIFKYPIYANAEKGKGLYGFSDIYKINENVVTVAGRGVNLGIAHVRNHKFYPIVRLLVLKPKNNENIYFFEYCINNLNILLESTGVPQLTSPQISNYSVIYPTSLEQQKLASFLTAVNDKLQALKGKKALLEQYKKGVMQKIFLQEIRFKDVNGQEFQKWDKKKLGEVADKIMYGMNSAAILYDGENKYLRITDIDENSRIFSPNPLTSPNGLIEEKYKLKEGDIVFARTGASVGKSYLYNKNDGNLLFAGFLIKFSITNANPYFIFTQTLRESYNKWIQLMSMRTGQPGVNAEEYKTFSF